MEKQKMWLCPKCGREFKRVNQSHYCGKAPQTIPEYIEQQPAEIRAYLTELHKTIRDSVPYADESILWSMPYYKNGEKTVSFAACKNHMFIYRRRYYR